MNIKAKIATVLASVGLVIGLGVVAAPAANAFSTITYTATCPAGYSRQQLVVQNFSGSTITIQSTVWQGVTLTTNSYSPRPGALIIHYHPVRYSQTATYTMWGSGNLNWYYHVDCLI